MIPELELAIVQCMLMYNNKNTWNKIKTSGKSVLRKEDHRQIWNLMPHKSNICCCCSAHGCLTSGTHMAALKQTCLARYWHLGHRSQTSRSTVRLCLTPPRASIWTSLTPTIFTKSLGLSTRAGVSAQPFFLTVFGASTFQLISLSGSYVNICTLGPEYEEVEVHLLREKTGFGFRILGGDEAVQAVSLDARDKARMGRAGSHAYLTSYTTNLILPPLNHISLSTKRHTFSILPPSLHAHTGLALLVPPVLM